MIVNQSLPLQIDEIMGNARRNSPDPFLVTSSIIAQSPPNKGPSPMKFLPPFLLTAIAIVAAYFIDLPTDFGAHPWWGQKAILIGAPIGLALTALAIWLMGSGRSTFVFIVFFAVSFGIAYYGKTAFAASFAEDQLAGKLWYFGWIATCSFAVSFLFSLLSVLLVRRGNLN
jgi:hypothetical protein